MATARMVKRRGLAARRRGSPHAIPIDHFVQYIEVQIPSILLCFP
jgi:hypothetical protein